MAEARVDLRSTNKQLQLVVRTGLQVGTSVFYRKLASLNTRPRFVLVTQFGICVHRLINRSKRFQRQPVLQNVCHALANYSILRLIQDILVRTR